MPPIRFLPAALAALLAAGCTAPAAKHGVAPEYRGLESQHQPIVDATGAYVPGCPDWSDSGKPQGEAQSANYGCALNGSLAAMIADPQDLLHGRDGGGGDGSSAYRAVKAWRETELSGKQGVDKQGTKAN